MSDQDKAITKLITDSLAILNAVEDDPNASEKDKQQAFETYEDLLLLIGRQAITSYEGRTALLTGLIAELAEITKNIQVDSPIAARLGQLADIGEKAGELFKLEKKSVGDG